MSNTEELNEQQIAQLMNEMRSFGINDVEFRPHLNEGTDRFSRRYDNMVLAFVLNVVEQKLKESIDANELNQVMETFIRCEGGVGKRCYYLWDTLIFTISLREDKNSDLYYRIDPAFN